MTTPASLATPVIVVTGNDTMSRESLVRQVVAELLPDRSTLNEERFDSSTESLDFFLQRAMTPSLFGGMRLFSLRHAQSLSKTELKRVDDFLDAGVPDVFLLIETDAEFTAKSSADWTAWLKTYRSRVKKHPKRFSVHECTKPREYEIPGWLTVNVPRLFHRTLTKETADYLVDRVGTDFDMLQAQLMKIDVYLEPGTAVTVETVKHIVSESREIQPQELANALGLKENTRVLNLIDKLFAFSVSLPFFTGALFRHFYTLLKIRRFGETHRPLMREFLQKNKGLNRARQNALAVEIGKGAGLLKAGQENRVYPVLIKPRLVHQAQRYTMKDLSMVFRCLFEFDLSIRSGNSMPDKAAFQMLCMKILAGSKVAG